MTHCRTPKECANQARRWPQSEAWLQQGQDLLNQWNDNRGALRFSDHASEDRMLERAVSQGDIRRALRDGIVIHRDPYEGREHFLVLAWVPIRKKVWQPLHIAGYWYRGEVKVITVYDPRTEAWMWTPEFDRRVCWCHSAK